MNTVIFITEEAIFQFDRKTVMECLEHRKTLYEIKELDTLIQVLSRQSEKTILESTKHQYLGLIVLDLISAGKGSVVCKNCSKKYLPNQIKAFAVRPDETTFKVNTGKKGGFKSLFRKKSKPFKFAMYSGRGLTCPEGHTLIFMVTECISLRV